MGRETGQPQTGRGTGHALSDLIRAPGDDRLWTVMGIDPHGGVTRMTNTWGEDRAPSMPEARTLVTAPVWPELIKFMGHFRTRAIAPGQSIRFLDARASDGFPFVECGLLLADGTPTFTDLGELHAERVFRAVIRHIGWRYSLSEDVNGVNLEIDNERHWKAEAHAQTAAEALARAFRLALEQDGRMTGPLRDAG